MEIKNDKVALDQGQCRHVAEIIQPLHLRKEFYRRGYLNVEASPETRFSMHFFAVIICHQTHNLYHPGLRISGWDFIEHVFTGLAKNRNPLLNPDFLANTETTEIASLLARAFSHSPDPAVCSLDRLQERARLMKISSQELADGFSGKVSCLFEKSGNRLINQGRGIYEQLRLMEAFADPQQKKSTFLIKLLMEDGLLAIDDPENFIPIMDYHMQRVLLRLGCVEITDPNLQNSLLNREPLETDEPVRHFCIEAFKIIAEKSGHPVTKMNDFFWSLGRSCCHETTLCHDRVCSKSPCTFTQIVNIANHSNCIFAEICRGAAHESHRKLWQPVVDTHYY
jgi:hypothetical protein